MKELNYEKWKTFTMKKNLKGEEALEAVKRDGYDLEYVKEQTTEICLAAVKENEDALKYVEEDIFLQGKIKVVANGKEVLISKESAEALGLIQ